MTKHCGEKMEDGRCVVCDYVEKLCPTCGKVIPTNGVSEERDKKGNYFYYGTPPVGVRDVRHKRMPAHAAAATEKTRRSGRGAGVV